MPPEYDENQGQDPAQMLKVNATLETRQHALLEIVKDISKIDAVTKVIVFADHSFGGYNSAKDALGDLAANIDDCSNEEKGEVLSFYKDADATEEDKKRPRVLLLTFAECAGLNLQGASYNVVLYQQLYSWSGYGCDPRVEDCSTELQAIGRVYRTGQARDVIIHKIVVDPPKSKVSRKGTKFIFKVISAVSKLNSIERHRIQRLRKRQWTFGAWGETRM